MSDFDSILFLIFGACMGSFANVLIWRIPLGQKFAMDRSRCPHCQKVIRWYDNVPLISFFILRRKCRHCEASISWRYPVVELLTALAFWALFQQFGWSWYLLETLIFVFGLIVVSFIDLDHMILPDVFTLPGIAIGLLGAALNPERRFLSALVGVLLGGGFLWAIAYSYFLIRKKEGMGGGDIKLLAWIGAVLGWTAIPFVVLAASLLGSLAGLYLALRKKGDLQFVIPFGPYLAASAVIYLFGGEQLGLWYVSLFLPGLVPSH